MIEAATKALIQGLKASVTSNTVVSTHYTVLEIAALPVCVLFLPEVERARIDDANVPIVAFEPEEGTSTISPPPGFYDLGYDIEIASETVMEALDLGEKTIKYVRDNPYLKVGTNEYPMRITSLATPSRSGELIRLGGRITVEGIEIASGKSRTSKIAKTFEPVYANQAGGQDALSYSLKKEV